MKYFTIKDVAERTGISAYTLRYYDKEGLLGFVERSESGILLFTEKDFEPLYQKLSDLLEAQGMKCGTSNLFRRFSSLRDHYLQALKTLSLGKRTIGINHFREHYFDYLLSFLTREQAISMVSSDVLHLLHLQKDYQFPLTETLNTYLDCNCNLQMTAEKLYIHKNTALYRVNHIKELLHADLEDAQLRMQLLFSFRILALYPIRL